jgi:hypothetical protein
MSDTNLDFSFLRTEIDDQYRLFLKINPSVLEQEIDINLNDNKQLVIQLENGDKLVTHQLSADIYDSLANKHTETFFTDDNANIIAHYVLDPLKPTPKNRMKP